MLKPFNLKGIAVVLILCVWWYFDLRAGWKIFAKFPISCRALNVDQNLGSFESSALKFSTVLIVRSLRSQGRTRSRRKPRNQWKTGGKKFDCLTFDEVLEHSNALLFVNFLGKTRAGWPSWKTWNYWCSCKLSFRDYCKRCKLANQRVL